MDVVLRDKNGRIVKDLTRDNFKLYETSKKLPIIFFEFVDAGKTRQSRRHPDEAIAPSPQGPSVADIRRIFAFVVDDRTIRNEDLTYVFSLKFFVPKSRMALSISSELELACKRFPVTVKIK